jgi:hypothetical protein
LIKKENVYAVAWDKQFKTEYSKIKSRVNRLHNASEVFYSAFPALHYPHFRADTKKKVRGGLVKAWKAPLDWLAHCRHWRHLCDRMALYGNEMVGLSETCSTMANCVCGTIHSPGRHHFKMIGCHHFSYYCKRVKVRYECPRMIGVMGDCRILQRKAVLADGRKGVPASASAN